MIKKYSFLSLLLLTLFSGCTSVNKKAEVFFDEAVAVWPVDLQFEKNLTIGFRAEFENPGDNNAILKITGSSLYRIFLNNVFVGHGPARAGHGYYRVDEWNLDKFVTDSLNTLVIEVASYNVNSYYLLNQPGFVQAEVVLGGNVIASTSDKNNDFLAYHIKERIQKVPRYSFQRPFIEYYRIIRLKAYGLRLKDKDKDKEEGRSMEGISLEDVGPKELIARRIPYPDFTIVKPQKVVAQGTVETGIKRDHYWRDRAVTNIGPKLGGFPEDELEYNPAIELQEMENSSCELRAAGYGFDSIQSSVDSRQSAVDSSQSSVGLLKEKEFVILDMGTNLSGFIGLDIQVHKPTRLFVTFDEILQDNDVNFKRLGTIAALTYDLQPETRNPQRETRNPQPETRNSERVSYLLESFEPYTFRYAKIMVAAGEVTINDFYLREYTNPDVKRASFESSDERLNRIFKAGVETFRQNAVDIFMDCPHRERAGWLCDSYFTSRVAQDISGNSLIEKNFYENFLLPDSFSHLPKGMLPMCYPADHNDSVFIPNWAMWFVVELEEYYERSRDRQLIDDLKPKVMALLEYFEAFKNEDGLLEKLESWVFVEWSAANRFVQDVNYPSNMLFAKTLEIAGELYGKEELITEAESIRETIREQSFNGQFFVDNAERVTNNELRVTSNTSEVCQYFAFFFDIATPETHQDLWKKLSTEFGPKRQEKGLYPDVYPANSFVGNYLRLELLSSFGLQQQLLDESIDYFDYMALKTGTLWENISTTASCNHGFASHVVHVLYRDILGISEIDYVNKVIKLKIPDISLDYCKGQMPIGEEIIKFEWTKTDDQVRYDYDVPDGYRVEIDEQ